MYRSIPHYDEGQELALKCVWIVLQVAAEVAHDVFIFLYSRMADTNYGKKTILAYLKEANLRSVYQELMEEGYLIEYFNVCPNDADYFDLKVTRKLMEKIIAEEFKCKSMTKMLEIMKKLVYSRNYLCHMKFEPLGPEKFKGKIQKLRKNLKMLYELADDITKMAIVKRPTEQLDSIFSTLLDISPTKPKVVNQSTQASTSEQLKASQNNTTTSDAECLRDADAKCPKDSEGKCPNDSDAKCLNDSETKQESHETEEEYYPTTPEISQVSCKNVLATYFPNYSGANKAGDPTSDDPEPFQALGSDTWQASYPIIEEPVKQFEEIDAIGSTLWEEINSTGNHDIDSEEEKLIGSDILQEINSLEYDAKHSEERIIGSDQWHDMNSSGYFTKDSEEDIHAIGYHAEDSEEIHEYSSEGSEENKDVTEDKHLDSRAPVTPSSPEEETTKLFYRVKKKSKSKKGNQNNKPTNKDRPNVSPRQTDIDFFNSEIDFENNFYINFHMRHQYLHHMHRYYEDNPNQGSSENSDKEKECYESIFDCRSTMRFKTVGKQVGNSKGMVVGLQFICYGLWFVMLLLSRLFLFFHLVFFQAFFFCFDQFILKLSRRKLGLVEDGNWQRYVRSRTYSELPAVMKRRVYKPSGNVMVYQM